MAFPPEGRSGAVSHDGAIESRTVFAKNGEFSLFRRHDFFISLLRWIFLEKFLFYANRLPIDFPVTESAAGTGKSKGGTGNLHASLPGS